jgi:hypothetical protein
LQRLLPTVGHSIPVSLSSSLTEANSGVTSFEVIREVFWPGDLIYMITKGHERLYRVTDANINWSPEGKYLLVGATFINGNGQSFGTQHDCFKIKEFSGIQYINELRVYPLKYSAQKEQIKARLLTRGKKFEGLVGQKYLKYKGVGLTVGYIPKRVSVGIL